MTTELSYEEYNDKAPWAYIGGTYDLTHYGHYELFRRIKEMGFNTWVTVNSDDFVSKYRKEPCILSEQQRLNNILSCRWVDKAEIVNKETQDESITASGCKVIVVGLDWMKPEILPQLGISEEFLIEMGISMMFLPRTKDISSTEIKEWMKKQSQQ